MGALSPLFLAAALAVGVPLFLHLFQRHETRRFSFPALRYLERTEREHARRIRLRQLILLVLRVAVLLLLVGAGARLFLAGRGSAHAPTAVVVVLDNSMSSGVVVGEVRELDRLKEIALSALEEATDEDRFWVLRAGEPWLPALPGGAEEARAAIQATEPSDARGDLDEALARARALLAASDLPNREIHLLSDLQATAFGSATAASGAEVPVVTWSPAGAPPENNGLAEVEVGRGLPPLVGQRSEVAVRSVGSAADTVRLPVRLVVDERIRGAATVPVGSSTAITLPATGAGWIRGYVDADPDALRADDRRYFAFRSRAAPSVAVGGDPGLFALEAVAVLEAAQRLTRTAAPAAELLLSGEGAGLEALAASGAALVLPPSDPTRLPALNRRLADAGIPWRAETRAGAGESEPGGRLLPEPLEGTRVRGWYRLRLIGEPADAPTLLAEVGGDPWMVQGTDALGRRYLLLGSPLDERSTSLPVSAALVRFIDWTASEWAGAGSGSAERVVGDPLPAPRSAAMVRLADGTEAEIDGTRTVRETGRAGFYTFLDTDGAELSVVAVNTPPTESELERLTRDELRARIGDGLVTVRDADRWGREVYRARRGAEIWWPLLLLAALLLAVEALVAASGRVERTPRSRSRATPAAPSDAAA